ncbi:MAG TPA: hypothetical protein ENJ38_12215 [Rhodospirillales bacterium]|nr:hypothetical protein [Rhodospirillales bacterium]
MDTCGLETTHEDFDDAEAAWNALTQAAPTAGWLQWQSHQTDFKGNLPEPKSGWGALLAAEAVLTGTDSLRLDYLDGRWRLTRYRHAPDGDAYLCDETRHLLHGARDRTLRYQRYWKLDEHQGAIQTDAVLIGID